MAKNQFVEILIALWQAGRRRLTGELFSIPLYRTLFVRTPATGPLTTKLPRLIKSDVGQGRKLAQGSFFLAGTTVHCQDAKDIWSKPVPSRRFAARLHDFSWIHDLLSLETLQAHILAGAHIDHWIRVYGGWNPFSWTPGLVARRCLNWLGAGHTIMGEGEQADNRRSCLIRQISYLHALGDIAADTRDRLEIAMAIYATGLLVPGAEQYEEHGLKRLGKQLGEQILPDGGHISRNPELATSTLCDLVSLKLLLEKSVKPVPENLERTLARLAPMVRFMCAADGHLAAFNGGGEGHALTTAQVLRDLAIPQSTFNYAPHSGYQKVKTDACVLIMDTGRVPPERFSQSAHAGALALELSTPGGRLVVNCGWSEDQPDPWHLAVRTSAAHSTLIINDTSSAKIRAHGLRAALLGPRLHQRGLANPSRRKIEPGEGTLLEASHGGYLQRYGLIHQRQVRISENGERLEGEDRVFRPRDAPKVNIPAQLDCVLRFHLHPKVRASLAHDRSQALLVLPDGTGWRFLCQNTEVELQPSVYLAAGAPPQRTLQLVVSHVLDPKAGAIDTQNQINWVWERVQNEP